MNANDGLKTKIYIYLSRRSLIKLMALSILVADLWINGCDHSNADSAPKAEIKKEGKMKAIKSITTNKIRIPAIDVAAPSETKTATFALG